MTNITTKHLIALIAALSFLSGCGQNTKKRPTTLSHGLPTNVVNKNTKTTGNGTNPAQNQQNPAVSKASAEEIAKLGAQKSDINKTEQQLVSGTPIRREDLPAGQYALDSVATSVMYMDTKSGDEVSAVHLNSVQQDSNSFRLAESAPATVASKSSAVIDLDGRDLDLPATFQVDASNWQPNRDSASNLVLHTVLRAGNTAATMGSYVLADNLQLANDRLSASVMKILATAQLSQDSKNASDSLAYPIKDEKGRPVILHIYKQDAQKIAMSVEFDEQMPDSSANLQSKKSVTFVRTVYLTYKVTPLPASSTPTPTPTAAKQIQTTTVDPAAADTNTAAIANPDDVQFGSGTQSEAAPAAAQPQANPPVNQNQNLNVEVKQ